MSSPRYLRAGEHRRAGARGARDRRRAVRRAALLAADERAAWTSTRATLERALRAVRCACGARRSRTPSAARPFGTSRSTSTSACSFRVRRRSSSSSSCSRQTRAELRRRGDRRRHRVGRDRARAGDRGTVRARLRHRHLARRARRRAAQCRRCARRCCARRSSFCHGSLLGAARRRSARVSWCPIRRTLRWAKRRRCRRACAIGSRRSRCSAVPTA